MLSYPLASFAFNGTVIEESPSYLDEQQAALASESSLLADTSPESYSDEHTAPFSGFFIGAGVNGVMLNGDTEFTVPLINKADFNLRANGVGFNANTGYGKNWDGFYLGGELFLNYDSLKSNGMEVKSTTLPIKLAGVEAKSDYGADLRLGYVPGSSTLLYFLAGVDYGSFDFKPLTIGSKVFAKKSENKLGFMPGIGIEQLLIGNLSLRAQFTYTAYSSININYAPGITSKTNLNQGIVNLGLAYHF